MKLFINIVRTQSNFTFVSISSGLPDSVSGGGMDAQPAIRDTKMMSMIFGMVSFLDFFLRVQ
jgi:hypothetical protein